MLPPPSWCPHGRPSKPVRLNQHEKISLRGGIKMQTRFINVSIGLAIALFTILALPTRTHAQLTRGAISGTVRDQAGAVLPGAQVKVINPQTNVAREAVTNDEGFYRIGAVEPGVYTVLVEKAGFSKIEN